MLFTTRIFRDAQAGDGVLGAAFGGAGGAVQAGLGVINTITGLIEKGKSKREIKRLQAQRTAYKTPDEVYKVLQATQQNAQTGLGAQILSYLTGQADRAFSTSVGAATMMGGDPNYLGALFETRLNASKAIVAQNHAAQMATFGQFLNSLNLVAENKAAEWQSRDNMIKDQIQAAGGRGADANKNITGGLNSIVGSVTAGQMMRLYGNKDTTPPDAPMAVNTTSFERPTIQRGATPGIIPRSTGSTSELNNPYSSELYG